uniref:Lipocalin n=1 Tax=Rhipicephalus zambeziensis TaxID=60191 RepID=A0A224YEG9_9ACAR
MAIFNFLLLCLFLSAIPQLHGNADMQNLKAKHKETLQNMPRPWEFMTNGTIYLLSSGIKYQNVTCIRAKAVEKNESAQTFTHNVAVKLEYNDMTDWIHMNATYVPFQFTDQGRIKAFLDNEGAAVTKYAFLLTTPRCAVVVKEKNYTDSSYTSTELWLKDWRNENVADCYMTFINVCNCNSHPTSYYPRQCEDASVH